MIQNIQSPPYASKLQHMYVGNQLLYTTSKSVGVAMGVAVGGALT